MKVQPSLRPVDLARSVGISTQSVRKYEAWGFLPPVERRPSGHRRYGQQHLYALEASRAMIAGYGWAHALHIMQQVHRGDFASALALIDARHAALDRSRREVQETLDALRTVAGAPPIRLPRRGSWNRRRLLRVGEAARLAGVRVSALRFWEEQGLLLPGRDPSSGYRLYNEEQVRALQIVTLLREAGYRFEAIRTVLQEMGAGRPEGALAAVERRLEDLAEASRRCAAATAALWAYVVEVG